MKIVSFDPNKVENFAAFFNKYLDEKTDEKYIMLIFEDIYNNVKDMNEIVAKYQELMETLSLPFTFFPYYIHFNKVLTDSISKPNPRAHVNIQKKDGTTFVFDVVKEPSYGMFILDLEALKKINFRFNENYKLSFYVQDLIMKCFDAKLIISNQFFIDIVDSYKLFNKNFKEGFNIDPKVFAQEKNEFFKGLNIPQESANTFIKNLKEKYYNNI